MISFHATPDRRNMIGSSSRKRSWEPDEFGEAGEGKRGSVGIDIELHLETPLPVEWQRCLDVQSGEVHFFNTRTNKRTCNGPGSDVQTTSDPPTVGSISLDLELNLQPYDDHRGLLVKEDPKRPRSPEMKSRKSFDEEEEMVATVCERCHMLVMLCVSRPACPNCKFVHSKPDHKPFALQLKAPKCTTQLLC